MSRRLAQRRNGPHLNLLLFSHRLHPPAPFPDRAVKVSLGARAAVAVDYSERRLWFGDLRSLVASGTAGPGSQSGRFFWAGSARRIELSRLMPQPRTAGSVSMPARPDLSTRALSAASEKPQRG